LNIDYSQAINTVSGWQTSFGFNESENLSVGGTERQVNFTISYNRSLTEDWDVIGGYRYRDLQSTTEADRTSNTFFLTLERGFAARP
jgi:outer membrane receptor for monomeric catechols